MDTLGDELGEGGDNVEIQVDGPEEVIPKVINILFIRLKIYKMADMMLSFHLKNLENIMLWSKLMINH
jgi:hypothetical protein